MGKGEKQTWERGLRLGDVEFYMERDLDMVSFGVATQISLSFSF